ncbi:hypothetical protein GCM10028777_16150 [Angustibacter speluncae]
MARRNVLVDGVSGSGKSTVFDELRRRGVPAVSTDRDWSAHLDPVTSLPAPASYDTWCWRPEVASPALQDDTVDELWVCGGARNRDRFLPLFDRVFHLQVDTATLRARLARRVVADRDRLGPAAERNWTPMTEAEVRDTLALHARGDAPAGAVDVDATLPVRDLVDLLLRLASAGTRAEHRPRRS